MPCAPRRPATGAPSSECTLCAANLVATRSAEALAMMLACARLGLTEEFDECRPEIEGATSSLLDVALRHCSVAFGAVVRVETLVELSFSAHARRHVTTLGKLSRSTSLSLCLCLCLCLSRSLSLSLCLTVSVSLSVSVCLCLSVSLSVSVSPSLCLSVSLSLSVQDTL